MAEHQERQRDSQGMAEATESERLKEEVERLEKKLDTAKSEIEQIKSMSLDLLAYASMAKSDFKEIWVEGKKLRSDIKKAETDRRETDDNLQSIKDTKAELDKQATSGPSVRAFVRSSLLEIMGGVNEAAAYEKTRELNVGYEEILPSVSTIGATSSEGPQSERVEFDIAVTMVASEGDESKDSIGGGFGLSVPLGAVSFSIGGSRQIEQIEGKSSSIEYANRIRFSVPISYATQKDSLGDE